MGCTCTDQISKQKPCHIFDGTKKVLRRGHKKTMPRSGGIEGKTGEEVKRQQGTERDSAKLALQAVKLAVKRGFVDFQYVCGLGHTAPAFVQYGQNDLFFIGIHHLF